MEDSTEMVIYFYDKDENVLVEDDYGGDGWASRLEWTATEDGTLCAKTEDRDTAARPAMEYNVSLSEM